eukprot:scaffold1269_cov400-Prasinococcus_capsulatus_cf.AAC.6
MELAQCTTRANGREHEARALPVTRTHVLHGCIIPGRCAATDDISRRCRSLPGTDVDTRLRLMSRGVT